MKFITIKNFIRQISILIACLFLCLHITFAASLNKDIYISKDGLLSMAVPSLTTVRVSREGTKDDVNYVTFTSGNGSFWMMDGEYHVDQFRGRFRDTKDLVKGLPKALPVAMRGILLKEKNASLTMKSCKFLGTSPFIYQCIATAIVQNIPAIYVGTSILNKNHLVNVYGLEPTWHGMNFHWKRYQKTMNSISIRTVKDAKFYHDAQIDK